MKERPILFSGPMVRAILEGRKTQTRRVVKARHFPKLEKFLGGVLDGKWNLIPLPYGEPGDRLWVRETWQVDYVERHGLTDDYACVRYVADNLSQVHNAPGEEDRYYSLAGKARDRSLPSIHMPRWASRITLEIVNVRVERLQDISPSDALAEGAFCPEAHYAQNGAAAPIAVFFDLWESINGVGSWDANPFCWVIEFKRLGGEVQ